MNFDPLNQFIFQPERYPSGLWHLQAACGAVDVGFAAADGITLHGWWFPVTDSGLATLFLHGNAGNVTHRIGHAQAINQAGSSVLVIDYRGYGKSSGRPSRSGVSLDAEAGYRWLAQAGFRPDHIVVHGESLGTAIASRISSRVRCAALVLESPFASLSSMANLAVPVLGQIVVHGFNTVKLVKTLRMPKLIIHGEADEIVPFAQGKEVFDAAAEPKEFWPIQAAGHNDLLEHAGEDYAIRLRAFYKAALAT